MELNKEQYERISECFPKQRKPAKISNLEVLNAVLYVVENGCKWRRLPKEYGNWHVIYVRVNRWAKKGVFQAAFLRLQQLGIIEIKVNVVSLDSTCIKVHPDGMGALKKTDLNPSEEHGADGTPTSDRQKKLCKRRHATVKGTGANREFVRTGHRPA